MSVGRFAAGFAAVAFVAVSSFTAYEIGLDRATKISCEEDTLVEIFETESETERTIRVDLGDCEGVDAGAFIAVIQALAGSGDEARNSLASSDADCDPPTVEAGPETPKNLEKEEATATRSDCE